MADLKSLREERGKLVHDARAIVDAADKEKRALTAEEQSKYDDLFSKVDELRGKIEREEKLRDAERSLEQTREQEDRTRRGGDRTAPNADKAMVGFRNWLCGRSGEGLEEFRALSAGVAVDGGYLVVPEQFMNALIKNVDDASIVRSKATIYPMANAASIGVPTLDADPDDLDWTTELQTGSEDSAMKFGKRIMQPHPLAKRIKVSQQLLRTAALPVESIVADRFAYKLAVTQEKAYMTGNGDKRPLGLFTASADGIPASRDVSTSNTTTAIAADNLRAVKYSLKAQYGARAEWVFHRDALSQISRLKDGNGQYLWREGIADGDPDTLLGRPVNMSEFAPNTFTTGLYVGLFGDLSQYWIIDSLQMQMQRLNELYSETNQVGFIARYEGDGAPVLAEAFARVKLA